MNHNTFPLRDDDERGMFRKEMSEEFHRMKPEKQDRTMEDTSQISRERLLDELEDYNQRQHK